MSKSELTSQQVATIDLLIAGAGLTETAEKVGVSRQILWQWKIRNPLFIAVLNEKRQELWGQQLERLRSLVGKAIDVLEEVLDSQNERLKVQVALHILRASLSGVDLTPKGTTDPQLLEVALNLERMEGC
jgi:hypothetical protein